MRLMRLDLAQPVQEYKPEGVQIKEWVTQAVIFHPETFQYATWDEHVKKVRISAGTISGWTDASLEEVNEEFKKAFNG